MASRLGGGALSLDLAIGNEIHTVLHCKTEASVVNQNKLVLTNLASMLRSILLQKV